MRLDEFLQPDAVIPRLQGRERDEILAELATALARHATVSRGQLFSALRAREDLSTTALEHESAIPHCRLAELKGIVVAAGVSPGGVRFDPQRDSLCRFFVGLAAPMDTRGVHVMLLARISQLLHSPEVREALSAATTSQALYAALIRADAIQAERIAQRLRPGV